MKIKAFLYIIFAGILWGCSPLFVGILSPLGFTSLQMTAIRSVVAVISMAACLFFKDKRLFAVKPKELFLFAAIGLQVGVGYSVGFLVFFFGSLFTGAGFGDALWMPFVGWCVVGIFAAVLACLIVRRNKQLKAEDEQKRAQKANKETVNA